MSAVGQMVISGIVQGANNPQLVLPPYYIPTTTSTPETIPVTLAASANTIAIPNASTNAWLIIVPPNYGWPTPSTSFTGTLTLKGVTGDTGYLISNTWPTVLALAPTSGANIVITSTAIGSMNIVVA